MLLQIEFEPFMISLSKLAQIEWNLAQVSTKKNNYTYKNMQFHFNVELVGIVWLDCASSMNIWKKPRRLVIPTDGKIRTMQSK